LEPENDLEIEGLYSVFACRELLLEGLHDLVQEVLAKAAQELAR
jgi:hypothetical protein